MTQLMRRNAARPSVSRQTRRRRSMMHERGGCMSTIRQARLQDARAIGRIEVETWRATYPGMLPDRVLIGMSEQRQTASWAGFLRHRAGDVWVAQQPHPRGGEERIVGFGNCGPQRD